MVGVFLFIFNFDFFSTLTKINRTAGMFYKPIMIGSVVFFMFFSCGDVSIVPKKTAAFFEFSGCFLSREFNKQLFV